MKSLFDQTLNHRELTRSLGAAALTVALAAFVGLSGVRLNAQYNATLRGVVHDPSGARIPNAKITVTSTEAGNQPQTINADQEGGYKIFVPPGTYTILIEAPGFARVRRTTLIEAGEDRLVDLTVPVGQIREELTVEGKRPDGSATTATAPSSPKAPTRIRVGGNIVAAKLTDKVTPIYPVDAKSEGVQGAIDLRTVIGKDGKVLDLQAIPPYGDQRLTQSAIDAVRQWRYKPTLLNGDPVEVITQVTVNFTLTK